jgi:hypothetical protein
VPDENTAESDDADDERDAQPTVSIGSEGFQPGDDAEGPRPGDAEGSPGDAEDGAGPRTTAGAGNAVPQADDEFGWRGWVLVGMLVVTLVVLPVVVTQRPVQVVGFRTTFLVLPLLPAFLLAATAVWVALRGRQG